MRKRLAGKSALLIAAVSMALLTSATAVLAQSSSATSGKTTIVSRADGKQGAIFPPDTVNAAISPGGRYVAFRERGTDGRGIFIRDVQLGRTRALAGPPRFPEAGDVAISADARYIVFEAKPRGTRSPNGVYVRDMRKGWIKLISHRYKQQPNKRYAQPAAGASISADGRFVAFSSAGVNLVPEHGVAFQPWRKAHSRESQVYVHDLAEGTTVLVSRATGKNGVVGDGASSSAVISANGRFVAFTSEAHNLDSGPGASASLRDVYVRDLRTNRTRLVSRWRGKSGKLHAVLNSEPSISANGRLVAWSSSVRNRLWVRDMKSGARTAIEIGNGVSWVPFPEPRISANGRFLVYVDGPKNSLGEWKLYVRDLRTGRTRFVHRLGNMGADPAISSSGRYISFDTYSFFQPGHGETEVRPATGLVLRSTNPALP